MAGARREAPPPLPADPSSSFGAWAAPRRILSSAGSGWDGAFFAELTTAHAGELPEHRDDVSIQRWMTPLSTRAHDGAAGWITQAPAVRVRFPGDPAQGASRRSTMWQLLCVTPGRVEAVLGRPWESTGLVRWRAPSRELSLVEDVLSAMARDVADRFPAGPLAGDALVVALLVHLDGRGTRPPSPGPGVRRRRLQPVLEYIEANLTRSLRLPELADVAGLHVRTFTDAFATETGLSPHRYVLHQRIARARSLMRDPALTLREIACAVGFNDPAQFSKVFRRCAGEAPSAHRRR